MKSKYDHTKVEKKWGRLWSKTGIYTPDINSSKNKFYNLMMFPYPSAEGLHAGNMFAFTGSDVYGRFKRMNGCEVFEPIGLDGFGIHSENYAIKIGKSPQENAEHAESNYYRQLREIGNSFDWTRTLETYKPEYYQWTQWLFVELFKAGLAYRKASEVNWCPSCRTVLADEQVMTPKQAGKLPKKYKTFDDVPEGIMVCERCGSEVSRKKLEQWFFRITSDSNRLLDNLKHINWPKKIKTAQRNWIGKKKGITIRYAIANSDLSVECWTSRPDTNFGASFIVISPDHSLLEHITTPKYKKAVLKYRNRLQKMTKQDKLNQGRKKTGVFTGLYAINNLTGKNLPIWVSDFVLAEVGTGAVVGVPGHDIRDFEFAKEFGLPIIRVVVGKDGDRSQISKLEQVQEDRGVMINSKFLDGLDIKKAKRVMMDHLEENGWGKRETHYHLRDWLISRQRYWGPPIPMIYCESCAKKGLSWFNSTPEGKTRGWKLKNIKQIEVESAGWYPEHDLPVELPKIDDYLPKGNGRGPLADHPEFYEVTCLACGSKEAHRETDVSDTFLDSAWYFLRYPTEDAKSSKKIAFDADITRKWLPVDLYFGGAEHAVLHLMYSRFITHVLYDLGYLSFEEPFPRFYAHGLVIKDGAKMSKSKGNVVNPDVYIEKYGADTLRLYLMFMGPMDGYPDFRDSGIEGMGRFLDRVWNLYVFYAPILTKEDKSKVQVKMHQTIKKVTSDIENFKYNTAIASIMEYVNELRAVAKPSTLSTKDKKVLSLQSSVGWKHALEVLAKLLAPFAPHMMEEVWHEVLGNTGSIHTSSWPKYKESLAGEESLAIAIQVDGRLRSTLQLPKLHAMDKEKVIALAKKDIKVAKYLEAKNIKKIIFVPGKIVNFVLNR